MSLQKQKDVVEDITEQSLLTQDGVAEEISEQAVQEEVDNFIADRSLKENQKEVMAIANKVAKYKKGDKTNFGVVVDVSASSITFKGKDTPKTKIVFNQRKMGSKDYVLSSLSKLNESMEADEDMEMKEAKRKFKKLTKDEFIKRIKKESVNEEDEEEELSQEEEDAWEASDALSDHFTYDSSEMSMVEFKKYAYKFVHIMDDGNRSLSTFKSMSDEKLVAEVEDMLGLGLEFDKSLKYGARVIIEEESNLDEDINWDLIQSMYVKNIIDYVVAPLALTGIAFGIGGIIKVKRKIKDWFADKKNTEDAKQLGVIIKDALEKIKKDSTAQDMIAQINANPYNRNGSNTERNKLIKPYKDHLKSILSDEQYEVLDDIYSTSLKEEMQDDMEEEMNEESMDSMSLTQLWNKHRSIADMPLSSETKAIEKHVATKFGSDVAEDMITASTNYVGYSEYLKGGDRDNAKKVEADLRAKHEVDESEEKSDEEESEDMEDNSTDIDELVSSEEGLTESFKEKASIIFEAAVASKVKNTKALLKEKYETRLYEEVESVKETLVEKIDSYLTYAVETWVNDNKVAVESTLRTEITESFIGSLKNLFTEHYIEVPESKVDLVSNMEQQVSSLKEQVATKGRIANALADRVEKLTRQKVIAEASAGLADTQIAKLTEMVEDVEFINEATFAKKVATIREFYINGRAKKENTLNENVDDNASFISKETIVENEIEGNNISPSMQNYLSAMSRMNKATTANLV
jgi:hypothetical protein